MLICKIQPDRSVFSCSSFFLSKRCIFLFYVIILYCVKDLKMYLLSWRFMPLVTNKLRDRLCLVLPFGTSQIFSPRSQHFSLWATEALEILSCTSLMSIICLSSSEPHVPLKKQKAKETSGDESQRSASVFRRAEAVVTDWVGLWEGACCSFLRRDACKCCVLRRCIPTPHPRWFPSTKLDVQQKNN